MRMRPFFALLAAVAVGVTLCVCGAHSQVPPEKTGGGPERELEARQAETPGTDEAVGGRATAGTDSVADWASRSRLIPVWRVSPTGVRIRSIQDRRKVIIVVPAPAAVPVIPSPPSPRPEPQYSVPPVETRSPVAAVDSAFLASVLTRRDLEEMEARLQKYLDTRLLELRRAEQMRPALRESLAAPGVQSDRTLLVSPRAGGTGVVLVPVPVEPGAPLDTAKLVAEIAARLAEAAGKTLVPAESLATVSEAVPADTSGVVQAPPETDTLGVRETEGPALPGPGAVQAERPVIETGMLRAVTVLFETNRATLLQASLPALDELGRILEKHPEAHVEIGGHTDGSGPAEYNLRLSQARAESVRDYLLRNFAIDADRLVARGYGESRPVASDDTATGRALNRRVEFAVTRTEGH